MSQPVYRIWDFRGDQAGIVWFRKKADGSAEVLGGHVNGGLPLNHYARVAHARGIDHGSVDYVRSDAHNLFEAMQALGLNPEVLPQEAWRAARPFA